MRENRTYGSEGGERSLFPTPMCVREFALSAKWESLPCEAMTHEAEGNCVAAVEE